jgi:hypothetical protein
MVRARAYQHSEYLCDKMEMIEGNKQNLESRDCHVPRHVAVFETTLSLTSLTNYHRGQVSGHECLHLQLQPIYKPYGCFDSWLPTGVHQRSGFPARTGFDQSRHIVPGHEGLPKFQGNVHPRSL